LRGFTEWAVLARTSGTKTTAELGPKPLGEHTRAGERALSPSYFPLK
jgi:hypothetical protein